MYMSLKSPFGLIHKSKVDYAKPSRTYSRQNIEAIELLADMIRAGRIERKITTREMATRAGVSRTLLQRIEKGDPSCAIGAVFEVAVIAGVSLFRNRPRPAPDTSGGAKGEAQLAAPGMHANRRE